MIRFVLFDAVGTLLRVQPSVAEIYFRVGQRFGSQLAKEEIHRRFSDTFLRQQDLGPTDEDRERQRWLEIVTAVFHDLPTSIEVFEELWEMFGCPEQWELFEDVAEAWTGLQRREFALGIASNFDQRLLTLCERFPPLNTARSIFISSQIGFPKPHTEFFGRVESQLNARPEQILLVGDSMTNDVEGARGAGWQAIHLDRGGSETNSSTITDLRDLLKLL